MEILTEKIYYADREILDIIKTDFHLIDTKAWYQLYQHKTENTFWRLDEWDQYLVQFFVKLSSIDNWTDFDDKELRIALLKRARGIDASRKCIWKDCERSSLQGLVFCEKHAYEEMGIRK